MLDDFGRGNLNWTADQWLKLDALAADTVSRSVVMRNVIDHRVQENAASVKMAGKNVAVIGFGVDFRFDMQNEDAEDLERHVRIAAQKLAVKEDEEVIKCLNPATTIDTGNLDYEAFIKAKNELRNLGVQDGVGIVVSTTALTNLETQLLGAKSGMEVIERVVGAAVAQSNALGDAGGRHGILLQASPAAYRMVHAYGPRLRVLNVQGGAVLELRLEEGVAIGTLADDRCVEVRFKAKKAAAAKAKQSATKQQTKTSKSKPKKTKLKAGSAS